MTLEPDTPIRKKAFDYIEEVKSHLPMATKPETSAGATWYAKYTGNNQAYYDKMYPSGNYTGCNAFCGTYTRVGLGGGYGPFAGGFFMDSANPEAWVASEGNTPKYGDICLQTGRGHVFVILDLDPLTTIQGGWNGSGRQKVIDPATGQQMKDPNDKTGKKLLWKGMDTIGVSSKGVWSSSLVHGWLDIDKLFPDKSTAPQWTVGWWKVTWDEDTYYYYFARDQQVYWTERPPRMVSDIITKAPPDGGGGRYSVGQSLNISWRSGSKETFWYGKTPRPMQFWGNHNGQGVLQMDRME